MKSNSNLGLLRIRWGLYLKSWRGGCGGWLCGQGGGLVSTLLPVQRYRGGGGLAEIRITPPPFAQGDPLAPLTGVTTAAEADAARRTPSDCDAKIGMSAWIFPGGGTSPFSQSRFRPIFSVSFRFNAGNADILETQCTFEGHSFFLLKKEPSFIFALQTNQCALLAFPG